jgi:hypothetical protein
MDDGVTVERTGIIGVLLVVLRAVFVSTSGAGIPASTARRPVILGTSSEPGFWSPTACPATRASP